MRKPNKTKPVNCTICDSVFEAQNSLSMYCSVSCKRKAERERRKQGNYAVVYWIKDPEHTDPYSEGYIGTTVSFYRRTGKHKERGMLRDNREITILHEKLTRDEGLELEAKYRPAPNIGWNTKSGGYKTSV